MQQDHVIRFLEKRTKRNLAALVSEMRDEVLSCAWRVLGDRDAAEDVAQEVFLKLLTFKRLPEELASGRAYLRSMAVRAAIDRLREAHRRKEHEDRAVSGRAADADASVLIEIRDAVLSLPTVLRRCLELRYFAGLGCAEVARELGLSTRSTNHHLNEAHGLLRRKLSPGASSLAVPLILAGGAAEAPSIAASPELRARLREVVRRGLEIPRAGSGTRPAGAGVVVKLAAVVLLVGSGAWVWSGVADDHDETLGSSTAEPPAVAAHEQTAARRARTDAADVTPTVDPAPPSERNAGTTGGAAGGAATTRLEITVVDETGRRVEHGRLAFEVADLMTLGAERLAELSPHQELFDDHDLRVNPFVLEPVPAAMEGLEIVIRATAPGYAPARVRRLTVSAKTGASESLVVNRGSETLVTVRDAVTEEVLSGAEVVPTSELRRYPEPPEDGPGGTTDALGQARLFPLGPGPHVIDVRLPGYQPAHVEVADAEPPATLAVAMISIERTATVRIELMAPPSVLERELTVLVDDVGTGARREVHLDRAGRGAASGLAPGLVTVHVEALPYARALSAAGIAAADAGVIALTTRLEAGSESVVQLGLVDGDASLAVTVIDGEGLPMSGADVTLSGPRFAVHSTDASGRTAFEGLVAGTYELTLGSGSTGAAPVGRRDLGAVDVASGARVEREFRLGSASLRGRAFEAESRRPIANTTIYMTGATNSSTATDADGRFAFDGVLPGTHELGAIARGKLVAERVEVVVPQSGDPEAVELAFRPGFVLLVAFRERGGGAPADLEATLVDATGRELLLDPVSTGAASDERRSGLLLPGSYVVRHRRGDGPVTETTVDIEDSDRRITIDVD